MILDDSVKNDLLQYVHIDFPWFTEKPRSFG